LVACASLTALESTRSSRARRPEEASPRCARSRHEERVLAYQESSVRSASESADERRTEITHSSTRSTSRTDRPRPADGGRDHQVATSVIALRPTPEEARWRRRDRHGTKDEDYVEPLLYPHARFCCSHEPRQVYRQQVYDKKAAGRRRARPGPGARERAAVREASRTRGAATATSRRARTWCSRQRRARSRDRVLAYKHDDPADGISRSRSATTTSWSRCARSTTVHDVIMGRARQARASGRTGAAMGRHSGVARDEKYREGQRGLEDVAVRTPS